jgi:uncharacterized protein YjcR
MVKGEEHHLNVLTSEQALAIYHDGRRYRDIASDYGIAYTSVRNIKIGKAWRQVTGV